MKQLIHFQLNSILWGAVILLLCGLGGNQFPSFTWDFSLSFDKIIHITFYAVLTLLITVGYYKQHIHSLKRRRAWLVAMLVGISYGIVVEWMQANVFFERSADFMDMIANTEGSILGVGLFYLIYGKAAIVQQK